RRSQSDSLCIHKTRQRNVPRCTQSRLPLTFYGTLARCDCLPRASTRQPSPYGSATNRSTQPLHTCTPTLPSSSAPWTVRHHPRRKPEDTSLPKDCCNSSTPSNRLCGTI